jgi:hypothetical protein
MFVCVLSLYAISVRDEAKRNWRRLHKEDEERSQEERDGRGM